MHDKYLKTRVSQSLYSELKTRAAEQGKLLGTYVREQLELESKAADVIEVLARIEEMLKATSTFQTTPLNVPDQESRRIMREVLLLGREIAMDANAQILSRVAAQLIKFN